jgi:hypothetical protein
LGDDVYEIIAAKTGIPGGRGHSYYEQWRTLPEGDEAASIAEQSKTYYETIRGNNAH